MITTQRKAALPIILGIILILGAISCDAVSVSITPSSDQVVAKDDSVTFSCSPSGGCGPYAYSWSFANASGSPPTTNQNPGAVAFGQSAVGTANTVSVTVRDKDGATDSKSIKVTVPKIEFDTVTGADSIGDSGGEKIYATAKGSGEITVKLKRTPASTTLPSGFIAWNGGTAGADQLTRTVTKASVQESGVGVGATANGADVLKSKLYVFESGPPDAAVTVNIKVTRDNSICTSPFGLTDRSEAFAPTNKLKVYYDSKKWKFVYDEIKYEIKWGTNSGGRANVPNSTASPFPLGMGMASGSTESQKKTQAKSDLTPDASGRAPRAAYWSQALTEQHELFHVSDWRDNYHKPKITEAESDIEAEEVDVTTSNLVPADVLTGKQADFDQKVLDKTNEAQTQYNPDKETRAYGDGKSAYQALSNAITP